MSTYINKICEWCEGPVEGEDCYQTPRLCDECWDEYDNQTGYCPLECCMGMGCDGSC